MSNDYLPSKDEVAKMLGGVRLLSGDIETTGISAANDEIIELGLIEVINGEVKCTGECLLGGGTSAPQALAVHGITDESRAGKPTFQQKSAKFKSLVEKKIVDENGKDIPTIFVGHNFIKFDWNFLCKKCRDGGNPIVSKDGHFLMADTLLLSREYLSSPSYKLEDLCKKYKIKHGGHRGLGDSYSSLYVLMIIMKQAGIPHISKIVKKVGIK